MLGDMFTSKWRTVTKHNYSEREGRWQQYIKNSQPIPNNKDVTCFIWQSYISSVQSMPTIKGSSLCMLFYMSCQIFLLWLNSVRSLPRPAPYMESQMFEDVGICRKTKREGAQCVRQHRREMNWQWVIWIETLHLSSSNCSHLFAVVCTTWYVDSCTRIGAAVSMVLKLPVL